MPPPRKVDLLSLETKLWLEAELRARGFADYVALTEALNQRLANEGSDETLHPATVGRFGQEYREFVKYQDEASAWAAGWMQEQGLADEAKRHNVLFQMITTLAFKVMKSQMEKNGDDIDPKELHFLGKMLNDVMSSSGKREIMVAADRKTQASKLDAAVASGEVTDDFRQQARQIMGFA